MSASVPRLAESLDDLRVGQVVAWLPEKYGSDGEPPRQCIGTIELRDGIRILRYHADNGGGYDTVSFAKSVVVILSDPPEPPVTVPVELLETLESAANGFYKGTKNGEDLAAEISAFLVDARAAE